jgi:hypothetical protein
MRGFSFAREVLRESSAGKDNLLLLAAAASGWKKILSRLVDRRGRLPESWEAEIMFSLHNEFVVKLFTE